MITSGLGRWLSTLQSVPTLLGCISLFVLYLALSEISYLFVFPPESNAVFWLPSGLTLAWFLRTTPSRWPAWFLVVCLAEGLVVSKHGLPLPVAMTWGAANGLLPVVGASLLRRPAAPRFVFRRANDVVRLALLGALIAAIPGACLAGAVSVAWLERSFFRAALSWWSSDALGVILLCPLLLAWMEPPPRRARTGPISEVSVLLVMLMCFGHWVFASERPREIEGALPALLFPITAVAALRFGPRGATTATAMLDILAAWHTSHGRGPFAMVSTSVSARLLTVQTYVAFLDLFILILAVVVIEEQAARAAIERSAHRTKFLAMASEILSESLDFAKRFDTLERLCVQALGDFCMIDLIEGSGIRRIGGAYGDAMRAPFLRQLAERYVPHPDSPQPAGWVFRTGKPLLLPILTDEVLRMYSVDEENARLIRKLGLRSVIAVPICVRGRTIGAISLGRAASGRPFDADDLDFANEIARRAAVAIDNARLFRDAQDAIRLRDDFLSVASHELNTPVTILQLTVQRLKRGAALPIDSMSSSLSRVERQIKKLARLVEELLDVTRITAGHMEVLLEEVDLSAVVRDVTERHAEDLSRAACAVSLEAEQPVIGRWDRIRLEQVTTNLLANAIKFAPGRPIEISVVKALGTARLVVRDYGIGIPADRLPFIFERFERAVSARAYGGLGLGLYIARSIVEALGGRIRAESMIDSGTIFTVELPCGGPTRPPTRANADVDEFKTARLDKPDGS